AAEHPSGRTAARARRVVDDREIAGAEADHGIRVVVHRRHDLADGAVRYRLTGLLVAHLHDRVLDEVHAGLLRALVGDHPEVGGAEALAHEDAVLLLELAPQGFG